ncbi:MAG: TraB/GumN family protein [Methanobacteriota archaeon]
MLTIVGTGHVLDIGKPVRAIVKARAPSVVALELDPPRFHGLQHPELRGRAPLPYMIMAFIQRRLAKDYGGQAGDEMLAAADEAKKNGASVALVDKDARLVFEELNREIPIKEKVKIGWAMLASLFLIGGTTVDAEMERYKSDEASYLEEFGKEFPAIKEILLDRRNEHMARALRELDGKYPSTVAFVGDGHVEGLRRLLADLSPEIIRLKDLTREGFEPEDIHFMSMCTVSDDSNSNCNIQFQL